MDLIQNWWEAVQQRWLVHQYRAVDLIQHRWLFHHYMRRRRWMAILLQRQWRHRRWRQRRNIAASTIASFWRRHKLVNGLLSFRDLIRTWQRAATLKHCFRQWVDHVRHKIRRNLYLRGFMVRSLPSRPRTKYLIKEHRRGLLLQCFQSWKGYRYRRFAILRKAVYQWRSKRRRVDFEIHRLDRVCCTFMLKFTCDFFEHIKRFETVSDPPPVLSLTGMMNMYLRKVHFIVINGPKTSNGYVSWLETMEVVRTDINTSCVIRLLVELVQVHPQLGHLQDAVNIIIAMNQIMNRMVTRMVRLYHEMSSESFVCQEHDLLVRHRINSQTYHCPSTVVRDIMATLWQSMTTQPLFMVFGTYETMRPRIWQWFDYEDKEGSNVLFDKEGSKGLLDSMQAMYRTELSLDMLD